MISSPVLPTSVLNIFTMAFRLYFKNIRIFLILAFILIVICLPVILFIATPPFTDLIKLNLALNSFESILSILFNSLIIAIIPKLIGGNISLYKNFSLYFRNYFGKILLIAIILTLILFIVSQRFPTLLLLTGIFFVLVPLIIFIPPARSIIVIFTDSISLVLENLPKIFLFLLISSLLFSILVLFMLLTLYLLGYGELFVNLNQLLNVELNQDNQQLVLWQDFISSPIFSIIYLLFQLFYQPIKSLLISLLFIYLTNIKYKQELVQYWNNFSQD